MNTPFFDRIKALGERDVWLHVPGHKGNPAAIAPFAGVLPFDLTEIDGADDLQHPSGPLAESEANMTRAFGFGASLYTAFGCGCAIKAMLTLYVKPGQRVLMARNCHVSAVHALAFLGAEPVWIEPDEENRLPLPEAELAFLKNDNIAAIYVTSPDYFGFLSDIESLARVAHAHNVPLLVDNAHGAHLQFCAPPRHPLSLGADASADSAHKTLPCLTGAALLQLKESALKERARWALNLHGGTSPSYLVLCSLDLCAAKLLNAPPDFAATAKRVAQTAAKFPRFVLQSPHRDPCKLTLCPTAAGYPAALLEKALVQEGIYPELTGERYIVLMAGPYNTENAFERLEKVLAAFPPRSPLAAGQTLPKAFAALSLREAVLADTQTLPTEKAVGQAVARVITPCPPGIPVIMPGEILDRPRAALLIKSGISSVDVVK